MSEPPYLVTFLHTLFRFEIEIEPIFGILALYDIKEKKKVFFSSLDDLHLRNAELMLC